MSTRLSACVIASEEEDRLPECLESLRFCDEVVVVDGGSRDRTREIAATAGALVIENPWPGFAAQRNVALEAAHGEWVLEIDADERVTPALAAEIERFLAAPPRGARMAALPMRDRFLGRPLGPAVRYPRYRHRLFIREAFRHDESRTVHEGLWPDGPTEPLRGELTHELATTWREALRDSLSYARLEAAQRSRPGAAEAAGGILLRPLAKFVYRTFLYGGWRDGWRGLAKIGLECAADSLATLKRIGAAGSGERGFGQQPPRLGPVRIVGVSLDVDCAAVETWLARAADCGADVALVATTIGDTSVRRRVLDSRSPGALARALDAEEQIRPVDALLLAGRRERIVVRVLPSSLRGAVPFVTLGDEPEAVVASIQRLTREPAPG